MANESTIRQARLGELIRQGVRSIAARQNWSMTTCYGELSDRLALSASAIRRWSQGRNSPSEDGLIVQLVTLGVAWGRP